MVLDYDNRVSISTGSITKMQEVNLLGRRITPTPILSMNESRKVYFSTTSGPDDAVGRTWINAASIVLGYPKDEFAVRSSYPAILIVKSRMLDDFRYV